MSTPLLQVSDLRTYFFGFRGTRVVKAVDGVSFTLEAGETMGLIGESGCGKTTTCHAIVRALPPSGRIAGGRVALQGEDLVSKSAREMREIRGRRIATILQDPMASLDPLFSIYNQVAEPAYYHQALRRRGLRQRVGKLLTSVRIPSPETRMKEFPHQMSGGMRQRIVGAIAQAGGPQIIIADEPTTNLDVTVQLQYLELLKELQHESGVALIFVTHDLGIIAKMCDKSHRIAVMYLGKIAEVADSLELCNQPLHPYTKALFAASLPSHPDEEREKIVLTGEVPSALNPPSGCHFHPRCPFVMPHCSEKEPEPVELTSGSHRSLPSLFKLTLTIRKHHMQQLTQNVFVETQVRGCNHGFVTTSEGVVMIDSPHKPSDALKLKAEIAQHGELRYIINTEPHGDHWTGNAYFDAPVVAHEGVRRRILDTNMDEHVARVATFGPEEPRLLEGYIANAPVITFKNGMTMHVGDHTFEMIRMPGHTPYQAAVLIKEEGVVFTSDNIFHKVQTWLHEANPDLWLVALESLRRLDEETFVLGHGAICDKSYLDEQGAFVQEWKEYVKNGIDRGMTKDEAVANLTAMTDRYPMDVGQDGMAPMVMRINVANLYDYLTGA